MMHLTWGRPTDTGITPCYTGHCCRTKSEKLLISHCVYTGVCVWFSRHLYTLQRLWSYLIPQALSYLTNSIFLCLLNNQSDSKQLNISHPLAHSRMGIDLHIKSYAPGSCDRDWGEKNQTVWLAVLLWRTRCIPWVCASSYACTGVGTIAHWRKRAVESSCYLCSYCNSREQLSTPACLTLYFY